MILWIDPWVRKLGYALIKSDLTIVDSGILLQDQKAPTREDQFLRIKVIYEFFEKLLKKHSITIVCMEKLFFTSFNQNNAEFVYGIRGALLALFLKHWVKIKELSPIELKKYITGNSKADKKIVQQFAMKIFGLKNLPEYNDAADALGLAYVASKMKL